MDLRGNSLGALLHSGMRKALDSRWSTTAWNFVNVMPPSFWSWWLEQAAGIVGTWPQEPRLEHVAQLFTLEARRPTRGREELAALGPPLGHDPRGGERQ